ncbi:MAG TPA: PAS domain S-box protein, partial [Burkholderiales bacterium]|nr:PAS domain S-box protein [Burkholderiales bacterium]
MARLPLKPRSVRVALIYLILAGWWLFASDNLLAVIFAGPENLTRIQQYKLGLLVAITVPLLYILASEALGRRPPGPLPGRVATLLIPVIALALLALGVIGSWFSAYRDHVARQEQEDHRALSETAALQAARVGDWIERRIAEARLVSADPLLSMEAARWLEHGAPEGATRNRLQARLASLRQAYLDETVLLLDSHAQARWATNEGARLFAEDQAFALQALEERRVLFAGMHPRAGAAGGIELDVVAPLLADTGPPPGAVYFRVDPRRAILPLLAPGAGAVRSQESLLLRREGSTIAYHSWMRFRPEAALPVRLEPRAGSVAGRLVGAGREGLAQGMDYRGVEVVAAARRIPGTDWYVLTKADAADLAAQVGHGEWAIWAVVAVLLGLAAGTMALWRQQQRARDHTRQLTDELERESWKAQALEREARLAALFDQAGDAVFVHDREGRIVEANEQAARSLGYSRQELCVMNMADV